MLAEPRHEPKVRQGVTTELIGVDGNAYAPFPRHEDLEDFAVLNGGLDGRPDIAFDWSTVAEYLARYDGTTSVNVAYVVGNSPLRIAALGWDEVAADARGHGQPAGDAARGDGGGRVRAVDRASTTRPAATPTPEELAELMAEAARLGGFYHTHVRYPLGDGFLDPFREAIEIGRRGGAPVHITHFYHRATFPGPPELMLGLVDDARAEGLDVTFDLYPYEWSSTRLLIMLPTWIQAGGVGPLKARLADRVRPRADPRRDAGPRPPVRRGSLVGRAAPRRLHPAGAPRLGGPDAGRRHARDGTRRGRRDLRPPARRGPRG